MNDVTARPVSSEAAARAHIDENQYADMYERSIRDPEGFWGSEARSRLDWIKEPTKVDESTFDYDNLTLRWFADGTLNVSANCIDRHLEKNGDRTAIIWEPDEPTDDARHISYTELHAEVCRFANVLKELGVKKGDRVVIYMPMIPEAAYAMLASARIGAVHSVVFVRTRWPSACTTRARTW